MKKIFCILLALLFAVALVLPAAAYTRSDLSRAVDNLNTYIYPKVYQEYENWLPFRAAVSAGDATAKNAASTDKEIEDAYQALKKSYQDLMREVFSFDDSLLVTQTASFIQGDYFDEALYQAYTEACELVSTNYESPRIYPLTNYSKELYLEFTQNSVDELNRAAFDAYNALFLASIPDDAPADFLTMLVNAVSLSIRESVFQSARSYRAYQAALQRAQETIDGTESARVAALSGLVDATATLLRQKLDYSVVDAAYDLYLGTDPVQYSVLSYSAFKKEVEILQLRLHTPVFYLSSPNLSDEEYLAGLQNCVDAMIKTAQYRYENLLPADESNKLEALIAKYENRSYADYLQRYAEILTGLLNKGKELLADPDTTPAKLRENIEAIEKAADALEGAHSYYESEAYLQQIAKEKSIKTTLYFAIFSIVTSAGIAVFLSRRDFGRIDWTK